MTQLGTASSTDRGRRHAADLTPAASGQTGPRERRRSPPAEWARRQLREKADEVLGRVELGAREALDLLKSLEAPIAPVETLIEESVAGRYSWS
jgi:hypothetical protein